MNFYLRPVHVQVNPEFERFAEEKFSKLERFFPGQTDITLIIKKEKFEFLMEAIIQYRRSKIFMKTKSNNLNAGLEELINKLKNQISKFHDKKRSKKTRAGKILAEFGLSTEPEEE
ncbi:MAG TPA: ribosome-associated translation inhibitor RaiA [bacterium]|nr:ribosome-associated translation inhibitor RaiA [bacterium]